MVQLNAPKSCLFLNKRFSISSVGSSESWCRPPPGSQAPGGGGPEEAEGGGPAGGSGVQKIEGTPPQRPLHPPPLPHKPPPPKLANNITTTATNHQPPCNVLELAPPTPTLSSQLYRGSDGHMVTCCLNPIMGFCAPEYPEEQGRGWPVCVHM